jgi:putative transposase
MRQEGKTVSIAQLCQWFGVPRSTFYYTTRRRGPVALDAALTTLVREIIEANPTFGVRRITVLVRRQVDRQVNRKAVHRIIRHHGWQVWQKPQGKRPRVAAWPRGHSGRTPGGRSIPRISSRAARGGAT